MPRAIDGTRRKDHRKKILKQVKGAFGRRGTNFKVAKELVQRSLVYAFRDRKTRKRNFRRLWIVRLNAALREKGLRYAWFINALKQAEINLDRKVLSNMTIESAADFDKIVALCLAKVPTEKI